MAVITRWSVRIGEAAMIETSEIPWPLLEQVVGGAYREFMFIGEVQGILLFKHIWTRRYLNVDRVGDTYRYVDGGYERIPRVEALHHTLS
jgi:hypothetical protein